VLVVILIVVVVLVIAGSLVTWVRRARSCARHIGAPAGQEEAVFLGGIMCKQLTTSGPMVKLEVFDWGVRIRGTAPARWVVPTWEARYEELAMAELVASPFSRIAVWLRLRGGTDGMGFLSDRSQEILRVLAAHEVPVNRALAKFKRVEDLYRVPPR
jgi:hypothetical protein